MDYREYTNEHWHKCKKCYRHKQNMLKILSKIGNISFKFIFFLEQINLFSGEEIKILNIPVIQQINLIFTN
jgi:hypothetical protein